MAAHTQVRRTVGAQTTGRAKEVVRRVLAETAKQLSRHGYTALSVDAVAAGAGVNKTTIYRRWPTKAELVAAAVRDVTLPVGVTEGTSLEEELLRLLRSLLRFASNPQGRGLIRVMQTDRSNPEVERIVAAQRVRRRAAGIAMVERAVRRGELPRGVPASVLIELVYGAVIARLTAHEEIGEAFLRTVISIVVAGAKGGR